MTHYIDISKWNDRIYDKPQKGSRPNNIFENPETGDLYYFKQSKASYPSEIWSEIIASKIGQLIGFNVLDYNIGYNGKVLGCISKSMIAKEKGEVLHHGVDVLSTNNSNFKVTEKPIYSFQDLQTLCSKNVFFKDFIENFIELIVFDAIIGNTDRHTENWALIYKIDNKVTDEPLNSNLANLLKKLKNIVRLYNSSSTILNPSTTDIRTVSFSPIYDSGSCLGRDIGMKNNIEIAEDIIAFLESEEKVLKYIKNAKSEIRWKDNKQNLFDITNSLTHCLPELTHKTLQKVFTFATEENINNIVDQADTCIKPYFDNTFLSSIRKDLIKELLNRRIKHLNNYTKSA